MAYFLQTPEYWASIDEQSAGIALANVSARKLETIKLPLAPFSEQQRIVSAIEERFTILDAVTTALQQNKQKLKLARASVLKYAVEGKLTEKWRAEHPATESGSQLLERILAERRAKWEAEQVAKGKDPRKLRYEEPAGPDVSDLAELPEGWCWATVVQLASPEKYALAIGPFGSNLKVEDYRNEGVPLVFVRNIRSNVFSGPETRYITIDKADELRPHQIKSGDILITKMGDPPGDACMYPNNKTTAVITADCIKWTLSLLLVQRRFFVNAINSLLVRKQILGITQGVAQLKVSLGRFEHIAIPFPPLTEQHQIVAEVERRLSVIEQAQVAIETSLKRIERARQSILERAFSGRLVSQDPHDEPASVLLERIQEERARRVGEDKQHRKEVSVNKTRSSKKQKTIDKQYIPLVEALSEAKRPLPPDDLFKRVGLQQDIIEDAEEFYEELREEIVVNKKIRQITCDKDEAVIMLEVISE